MTAETEDYEIPAGDSGHEPGTFLMTLTGLIPFKLYESQAGWSRTQPEQGSYEAHDRIKWLFSDEDGEVAEGTTSIARSERSTLYAWATGLGMPAAVVLDRSKGIPADQLIGRSAMVTVTQDRGGYGRVTSVVPAPKQRQAPATVEQPMTTLPNQVPAEGEFTGAPAPQPEPAREPDDLPF